MFVNVRAATGLILDAVICKALFGVVEITEIHRMETPTSIWEYFFPRRVWLRAVKSPLGIPHEIFSPTTDRDYCFRFADDYSITCGPAAIGYFAYISSVPSSREFYVEGSTRNEAILRCVALKLLGEVAQIPETVY